ncbi:hypothetical protein ACLMJK_006496 [Lecanora helva]
METDSPPKFTRDNLLKSLQGRCLCIPDIQELLENWPQYVHPELESLRKDVDKKLKGFLPETDSSEFSNLSSDLRAAQRFRTETIEYIRNCLYGDGISLNAEIPSNPIIASFRPIAQAISWSYTAKQNAAFFNELIYFVAMTDVEQ